MSLINEALKRARLEAARRDASEKGVPVTALPTYIPPRRNPWLAPLLGFVGGIAVVGIAAGGFWWMRAEPSRPDAVARTVVVVDPVAPTTSTGMNMSQPPVAPQPAAPQPATPALTQPAQRAAEPPPEASSETRRDVAPAETPRGESGEPARIPSKPAMAAIEPPPPPAPAALASGVPASAAPLLSGSYRREVTLAGGKTLKLDFIVWSEAHPFAQINGELVNPGQMVEGYILRQVERDRIELESDDGSFWLRVN